MWKFFVFSTCDLECEIQLKVLSYVSSVVWFSLNVSLSDENVERNFVKIQNNFHIL